MIIEIIIVCKVLKIITRTIVIVQEITTTMIVIERIIVTMIMITQTTSLVYKESQHFNCTLLLMLMLSYHELLHCSLQHHYFHSF